MRVLMLVLASDTQQVYKDLQESWKTFMKSHAQIDCWFYKADQTQDEEWKQTDPYTITVKCPDGYGYLYTKFIKALRGFDLTQYDYVCRPNESSFFIFDRYLAFLEDMPRTNAAFGKLGDHQGIQFLSGCGFTLTRDVAERMIALDQKDYVVDDVTVGIALQKLGALLVPYFHTIIDAEEKHALLPAIEDDETIFHIRCKHEWPYPLRRDLDVVLHKKLAKHFYHI